LIKSKGAKTKSIGFKTTEKHYPGRFYECISDVDRLVWAFDKREVPEFMNKMQQFTVYFHSYHK
jgi:hypothetical protein